MKQYSYNAQTSLSICAAAHPSYLVPMVRSRRALDPLGLWEKSLIMSMHATETPATQQAKQAGKQEEQQDSPLEDFEEGTPERVTKTPSVGAQERFEVEEPGPQAVARLRMFAKGARAIRSGGFANDSLVPKGEEWRQVRDFLRAPPSSSEEAVSLASKMLSVVQRAAASAHVLRAAAEMHSVPSAIGKNIHTAKENEYTGDYLSTMLYRCRRMMLYRHALPKRDAPSADSRDQSSIANTPGLTHFSEFGWDLARSAGESLMRLSETQSSKTTKGQEAAAGAETPKNAAASRKLEAGSPATQKNAFRMLNSKNARNTGCFDFHKAKTSLGMSRWEFDKVQKACAQDRAFSAVGAGVYLTGEEADVRSLAVGAGLRPEALLEVAEKARLR